jgi:hypothetical protein
MSTSDKINSRWNLSNARWNKPDFGTRSRGSAIKSGAWTFNHGGITIWLRCYVRQIEWDLGTRTAATGDTRFGAASPSTSTAALHPLPRLPSSLARSAAPPLRRSAEHKALQSLSFSSCSRDFETDSTTVTRPHPVVATVGGVSTTIKLTGEIISIQHYKEVQHLSS